MFNSMNIMSPTNMATAENRPFYTSLLPSILTSTFLPHWEDIWSPTRPALCNPPPLPPSLHPLYSSFYMQGSTQTQSKEFK